MADENTQPDSQKQRWLKYGSNVAIGSIVVIALAVLLIYLAQSAHRRIDTTRGGLYSLKPQTLNIIKDLKSPVKLISLYTTVAAEGVDPTTQANAKEQAQQRAQLVDDLLNEYKRHSSKIDVEVIDPVKNPSKIDDLITTLTNKYGGEVKKYRQFLDSYPQTYDKIDKDTKAEIVKLAALPTNQLNDEQYADTVMRAVWTVQELPKRLQEQKKEIDRILEEKLPDYKGAVDSIASSMSTLSALVAQVEQNFEANKADPKVPKELRDYMANSLPRYAELKKLADAVGEQIKSLGEIKLDTLRQSLRAKDSILVLGDNDIKVLTTDEVWQNDINRQAAGTGSEILKPRFAGEQQISSAILALTQKPKKIAFVRPGGGPLAEPGIPGLRAGGPFSAIAERLRDYNFTVVEKDLSGTYAMQAQMQGHQVEPEPSDADIKDAIWIVMDIPTGDGPMGQGLTISPKVLDHLNQGGSALILTMPQADKLTEALSDWGVSIATDQMIVHESRLDPSSRSNDMIEEAKKAPFIFVLNEYGDHLLTKPLRGLDGVFVPVVPVRITPHAGVTATPLLPIPQTPPAWAETDAADLLQPNAKPPTFDPKSGDQGPPVYGGAALDKEGKGRLVVIGSLQFATDQLVEMVDQDLVQRNIIAARFPANAELITNSIFWLAHMEPMIAISPAAMEVSRIGPISPGMLRFWRVGVLLIGLPLVVVLAGVSVYWTRKD